MTTPAPPPASSHLTNVSSMIYNEETSELWAGTGGQGAFYATVFSISPTGSTTRLADNYGEVNAHPGMTQRRSDNFIFGMDGDNDDLLAINNTSGHAVEFANDIDDISAEGNALTMVGENLYLASGDQLWTLDTFSGRQTFVDDLTLSGFPAIDGFNVLSMTTRPSDNMVFAILRDNYSEMKTTYLCTINIDTAVVTNIGQNANRLDGLCWVPADYFQTSP